MSAAAKVRARGVLGLKDGLHRWRSLREARRARDAWRDRLSTVLPDDVERLLGSMYAGDPQPGSDGQRHPMDALTRIPRAQGLLLYHPCLERRPETAVEIGLAYGFSSVFLLAALRHLGHGRLIALDPLQTRLWRGIGAQRGKQLGVEDRFLAVEQRAEHELPRFAEQRRSVQFAYIDGDHRFESIILDFTLVARLCSPGAIVVFDDLWLPSIRWALRFIEANRQAWKRIPSPLPNVCILEKVAKDERTWDHFVPF